MSKTEQVRAIIYAAKSTEDKHGSIPRQLADTRRAAEDEGEEVVAEYHDEAKSGWSGDRGPGLAAALDHAQRIGADLWVQHSDRLARGDGKKAAHLVEYVLRAYKGGFRLRSVQDDDACRDLLHAVVNGQRNNEDSERKSAAVRGGLAGRRERGQPVGAIPLGYVPEPEVIDGQAIVRRVIDPATRGTVERIFDLVEDGSTFGDVARTLNAEGVKTKRSGRWVSRTVRELVHNAAYKGEKGYPQIIEPDRFDAIHAGLKRLDPVQVAKRKGGRRADPAYFLRGIARCGRCGATLYTRRQAAGRVYVCANRRQGTGLCDAPPIEAELIESHVLRHLHSFVGSVEDWIAERLEERTGERTEREKALAGQQGKLTELDRLRERAYATYRQLLTDGKSTAHLALEEVERIDGEREAQERAIFDAEAVLAEHEGLPDVDAALDYYGQLVEHVQGRIKQAAGARALHDALSTVLASLSAEIEDDRERLLVEFELVQPGEGTFAGTLPPRFLGDRTDPEPFALCQTGNQTKVNRCMAEGRAALRRLESERTAA